MMKAIRHFGIVVSDLERSLDFYVNKLGLKVVKRIDESGVFIDSISGLKSVLVTTVKMAAEDGNLIELLYYKSHPRTPLEGKDISQIGASHAAFTVDNIDEVYTKLSAAGVSFTSSPKNSPDGFARVTFCKDPDGTLLELVEVLAKK
jgi:catechol 2,3-dioxygenase-like lactoylglutathione lyase family enzyme